MTKIQIAHNIGVSAKEIIAHSTYAGNQDAERVLADCISKSKDVMYGLADREIACIWGLIPPTLLSNNAWLWLLVTKRMEEHKFLFIRNSQRWMESALRLYPEIRGDAIVGNDRGIRWLKWLGAEFQEPVGMRIPFVIRAKNG